MAVCPNFNCPVPSPGTSVNISPALYHLNAAIVNNITDPHTFLCALLNVKRK